MSIEELEAEALKLPEDERATLVTRLLASMSRTAITVDEDPILGLGRSPVFTGASDGAAEHDRHLYGPEQAPSFRL